MEASLVNSDRPDVGNNSCSNVLGDELSSEESFNNDERQVNGTRANSASQTGINVTSLHIRLEIKSADYIQFGRILLLSVLMQMLQSDWESYYLGTIRHYSTVVVDCLRNDALISRFDIEDPRTWKSVCLKCSTPRNLSEPKSFLVYYILLFYSSV